ncbi:MAG: PTS sugar transporter subunit IIA [candidate division WOR-3 bacterium]|nr:MAG: PTS sugar transporter subunit IIA [candidate division WOR-3 bacterium]
MVAEFLDTKKILIDLEESTYRAVLHKMVGLSAEKNVEQVLERILSRENVMPTAVGKGIFLPRAIIAEKSRSEIILAFSRAGLVFEDYGTSVANIIMLFVFSRNDDYVAILAQSIRLLNDDSLRTALYDCKKPEDVITAIADWEKQ